ncbi:two-component system response regulator [Pseudomonas capsici]|uniref:EAL domain-containing protein n=1 Tax=Pseudomonas capsici TaxID=2810614 RepID=A0ABT3BV83_9PSED|nr:EAL domain-containing protein [Pseudomonas capsici]RMO06755.1 Response regulator/sensory box/GGDEF domain/EAL domain-containing protein [Pseudomonas cichorii]MBN6713743.1 EAL domain-containing protein [Pseudomonas capsici]MBN6719034.1 EAL domain-containing protein [Pseudomonas capsici]MBN6723823.1 EAL domain-containing protein [Pseudomonas capsici]MCV4267453.1 EAL domain-containing protein [Pseudomonas capsici]
MECVQSKPNDGSSVLLVVDDYPENLVTMCAVLQRTDWHIVTASSGIEALTVLLEQEVDLVLLDVQMPDMDGFEVARLMRGSQRTSLTPIIFLTANEQSPASVHKGYASGAIDYLFKPFDPNVLKPKVQALLEQQRNRRALQKLTQELESARAFNASVLANVAEGIVVVDEAGIISFVNPAICRLLDTPDEQLRGTSVLDYVLEPTVQSWLESDFYKHYLNADTYRVHDAVLRTATGGQLPVTLSCASLPCEQKAMVLTVLDMSMERNLYQQLEQQAVTDALTGLLNRRGFYQAVEGMLLRNEHAEQYLVVLYLDLDGFKQINDSLGHDAGDQVLLWVATQLKDCLRPYDVLARMGGDEFTVVIEGFDYPEQAAKVAEKLIERVSMKRQIDGVDISLGVSIGIATYPECGSNLDGLLRAADIAMYEAKRAGRQQYRFYDQNMNGRARSRLMLEDSVRNAIEGKNFSVVYQPQVHVADGRLRGFEALLRWQHASVGEVPPALFIPLLEETRLINRLGSWIFDQGAEQRQALGRSFASDLVVSVSVSPTQFCMPNLAAELRRAMDRFELQPGQLEVEITEASLVNNLTHSHKQLQQLREIGVRVALDDFGMGDCSLSHLRNLQLDTLKLDRHFIAGLLDSPRDAVFARSIIDLCRNLDILVIAEGVETFQQYEWLANNGCQVIQGFLVAYPLDAEDARSFPARFDWSRLRA